MEEIKKKTTNVTFVIKNLTKNYLRIMFITKSVNLFGAKLKHLHEQFGSVFL